MRHRKRTAVLVAGAALAVGATLFYVRSEWKEREHERATRAMMDRLEYFNDEARFRVPLRDAEIFSSLHIGYAGRPSSLAYGFVRLLDEPDAERALVDLVEHGAPGARLYALCGLSIMQSSNLAAYKASVAADRREVAVTQGCSFSVALTGEAAASSRFRQMCDEFLEAKREAAAQQGGAPDGQAPAAPARR